MPTNLISQLARRYRKLYPDLKFRIRRARLSGAFATTHLSHETGTFVVTLDKTIDQHLGAFLLAHEVAHALSWHMDEEEHGDSFWQAYRRTYKVYTDLCAGD